VLRKLGASNSWERVECPVRVRSGSGLLWKKHPDVDAAAIVVALPDGIIRTPVTTSMLWSDDEIAKYEISVGAELQCLGYPLGAEANPFGFPVLRSGRIASYPLLPSRSVRTFLFDFTVFQGNSGGPVYVFYKSPTYGGYMRPNETIMGVLGLVTEERGITQISQGLYERSEKTTQLRLGSVIHASFIRDLIDMLGVPKS